jgi:acylphosphatase
MRLKITGYAKNLANGDVEVMACGGADALQSLRRWLHDGPPMATVAEVSERQLDCQPPSSFEIA